MRKFFLIVIVTFIFNFVYSQEVCDCDTIKKEYGYSGYCIEYLNNLLEIVEKNAAQFCCYNFYLKGEKTSFFHKDSWGWGMKSIINYDNKIVESDSIIMLNGILKVYDRHNVLIYEYNFQNGYLMKYIYYWWSAFYPKLNKKQQPRTVVEYYYQSGLIEDHYNSYNRNEKLKKNIYVKWYNDDDGGNWYRSISKSVVNKDINVHKEIQ